MQSVWQRFDWYFSHLEINSNSNKYFFNDKQSISNYAHHVRNGTAKLSQLQMPIITRRNTTYLLCRIATYFLSHEVTQSTLCTHISYITKVPPDLNVHAWEIRSGRTSWAMVREDCICKTEVSIHSVLPNI